MLRTRKIGAWLTLLLFIGGLFAPSVSAFRADCPMKQAEREAHCAVTPEPVAQTPTCCHPQEAQLAPVQSPSTGCCCEITAAPERAETPAILSPVSEPVTIPATLVAAPVPPVFAANLVTLRAGNETAPRAALLRGSPTRAPPFA
ncbi:MAG: hypothetical protein H7Y38_14465 [Armatimonadetes bacterium]|nr:hypothetical protein [Armatimonadota bacterium]